MDSATEDSTRAAVLTALIDSRTPFTIEDEARLFLFFAAGMRSQGPNVETVTMPVADFVKALRKLRIVAPEGWKLVPIEPTALMIQAIHEGQQTAEPDGTWQGQQTVSLNACYRAGYKAMLAASPEPPK